MVLIDTVLPHLTYVNFTSPESLRYKMLESLLPNSHQARLWETFTEMYVDISREAQDDFQTLFGKAFLAAYESEVARLKGG